MGQVILKAESHTRHTLLFPWMTVCGLVTDEQAVETDATCNCGRCAKGKEWDMVLSYSNGFGALVEKVAREASDGLSTITPHALAAWREPLIRDGYAPEIAEQAVRDFVEAGFSGHLYAVTLHYPLKLRTLHLTLALSNDAVLVAFLEGVIRVLGQTEQRYFALNNLQPLPYAVHGPSTKKQRSRKRHSGHKHKGH